MNDTLRAVVQLGEKGFSVFPVRKPYKKVLGRYLQKKNGKYPLFFLGYRKASMHKEKICQLFENLEDSNVGIMTGWEYDLVIIDVDFPDGGETSVKNLNLPETLTVKTGNGLHLYYRHPGVYIPTCAGKLAPGIDIKGEESFATAPPSLHACGIRYRWVNENTEIADLPDSLVEKMRKLPHRNKMRNIISIIIMTEIVFPVGLLFAHLFLSREDP